ncbi:MAG TPA: LysE family translocator [Rhizomicrobium sp.]|jgi:threonine/homoserine/homoserine lactone efflux protein
MTSLSILTTHGLLLFIGAELIFSLTPGPTVMMISAYGIKGGFRDALAAIAGTQTGNTLWYAICVTGLGALVTASPSIFHFIRLLGAAYLVWLGMSAIWKSFRAAPDQHGPRLMGKPYIQATLTQMGNPKAILFFGAIVPQFLDTHGPLIPQYLIMFAITFIGESIILTGYGWLASHGARLAGLSHAVWRERISGLVLLALGIAAAVA